MENLILTCGENALTTESGVAILTESGDELDFESVPYTMLDWIESTGTQWIDTNVSLGGGFKVDCKIQITSMDTNFETIIGSHEGTSPYLNNFVRFRRNTDNTITWAVGERTANSATSLFTDYVIEASTIKTGQYLKRNGTNIISSQSTSVTPSSITPYIFARYNGTSTAFYAKMRLYYLKLYNSSNELVRDYIPVIDENNVVCLYDKVSRTYFYNGGSGTFKASETTTYKSLNYIGTSGTQYIDTGFKANNNTRVDTTMKLLEVSSSWGFVFGARDNYHSNEFTVAYNNTTWYSGFGGADQRTTSLTPNLTTMYDINKNQNTCNINAITLSNTTATFTGAYNMHVFAVINNGTLLSPLTKANCYRFSIYDNGTITKDLVPVLRKSDNEPCLYDLVNGEFYTNAGTGTFLYG